MIYILGLVFVDYANSIGRHDARTGPKDLKFDTCFSFCAIDFHNPALKSLKLTGCNLDQISGLQFGRIAPFKHERNATTRLRVGFEFAEGVAGIDGALALVAKADLGIVSRSQLNELPRALGEITVLDLGEVLAHRDQYLYHTACRG